MKRIAYGLGALVVVAGAAGCSSSPNESSTSSGSSDGITQQELAAGDELPTADEDGVEPDANTDGDEVAELFGAGDERTSGDTSADALSACRDTTGYRGGKAFSICVTTVEGHLVEVHTAEAYETMKAAAARDGVDLAIVSGFRTMEQQRHLYQLYKEGKGNLAAVPGFSNHQSGHALDLNTNGKGVYSWLTKNGATYGFKRTVPSEIWHWEVWGSESGGGGTTSPAGCHSDSLGRDMVANACVQSKTDGKWYQCNNGRWVDRWSDPQACDGVYPR